MSIRQMKEELVALGGSIDGCVEKADIVSRLLEARGLAESAGVKWPSAPESAGGGPCSPAGSPPPASRPGEPDADEEVERRAASLRSSLHAGTAGTCPLPVPGHAPGVTHIPLDPPDGGGGRQGEGAEGIRVAVEGCCHGELDAIYASVLETQRRNGITIDLLLICGDFQACRNEQDLNCMAVPQKYRSMASFYKYYSGEAEAPILTIFVGGNHEASNHLCELYHGGWVAPKIYYLGYAGVVQVGGLRIAGLSGIFKSGDYRQGHWERPPYDNGSMRSAYHVREYDVWKLLQLSGKVDIFLSHDWPRGVHRHGDERRLLQTKRFLQQEVQTNTLGNPHTVAVMEKLRPDYWFAAHLHTKFAALVKHARDGLDGLVERTKFLSLDKCLPNRDFLQVVHFPNGRREAAAQGARPLVVRHDPHWLAILRAAEPYRSIQRHQPALPCAVNVMPASVESELRWVESQVGADEAFLEVPDNFELTLAPHVPHSGKALAPGQPQFCPSPQTLALVKKLGIEAPHLPPKHPAAGGGGGGRVPLGLSTGLHGQAPPLGTGWVVGGRDGCLAQLAGGQGATNPDEIDIDADDVLSDNGGGEASWGVGAGNAEEISLDDDEA